MIPQSPGSAGQLPADVTTALGEVAQADSLLVVSDFDGTLAPFVTDPMDARPDSAAIDALVALAGLPGTRSALVSGRALSVLAQLSGAPEGVVLVGSHGAEFSGAAAPPTDAERELVDRLAAAATEITADTEGTRVELKPTAVVVHVRAVADEQRATDILAETRLGPGSWPGVHVTDGKAVVEMAIRKADKGGAIRTLAGRTLAGGSEAADGTASADTTSAGTTSAGSEAVHVVFLGDDVTDEHGFAALDAGDVGIKVGEGPTAAPYRVADIPAAVEALRQLAELRRHRN